VLMDTTSFSVRAAQTFRLSSPS